jgi:hypothetical protein
MAGNYHPVRNMASALLFFQLHKHFKDYSEIDPTATLFTAAGPKSFL